jgi:hypothetical protein
MKRHIWREITLERDGLVNSQKHQCISEAELRRFQALGLVNIDGHMNSFDLKFFGNANDLCGKTPKINSYHFFLRESSVSQKEKAEK